MTASTEEPGTNPRHAGAQDLVGLDPAPPYLWWLTLISGIIGVLFGMFMLSLRPTTILAAAVLIGIAFIFGGVGQIILAGRVSDWKWLFYVGGVLGVIAGIITFAWPNQTVLVVAVFVAWYLAFVGIFSLIGAFMGPKRDWWWIGIIVGLLEFLLGVWAIGSPGRELLLLINLIGIWLIFYGVGEIFTAFALRSQET